MWMPEAEKVVTAIADALKFAIVLFVAREMKFTAENASKLVLIDISFRYRNFGAVPVVFCINVW